MTFSPQVHEEAARSRLMVAVTFHFIEARLTFLAEVLSFLKVFEVQHLEVVIVTNTTNEMELVRLKDMISYSQVDGTIVKVSNLEHPYHLTWAHKYLVSEFAAKNQTSNTHFIYLEDDERLTFSNFLYFLRARGELKDYGLLPGFCRVEMKSISNILVSLDNVKRNNLSRRFFVRTSYRRAYVNLDNPFCGCFMLDQELAREYVRTPSFDRIASAQSIQWEVRERAAAGLTFENVPIGFWARTVVPFCISTLIVEAECVFRHLPNNYADDCGSRFGKIPLTDLLAGKMTGVLEAERISIRKVARVVLLMKALITIRKRSFGRNSLRRLVGRIKGI